MEKIKENKIISKSEKNKIIEKAKKTAMNFGNIVTDPTKFILLSGASTIANDFAIDFDEMCINSSRR